MDFLLILFFMLFQNVLTDDLIYPNADLYTIEGKVFPPDNLVGAGPVGNWQIHTRVIANGGEYLGFLR